MYPIIVQSYIITKISEHVALVKHAREKASQSYNKKPLWSVFLFLLFVFYGKKFEESCRVSLLRAMRHYVRKGRVNMHMLFK